MNTSRAHITSPKEIRADLDRFVDKRQRSKFVTDALRAAAGSWKDGDHPELKTGTRTWIKGLRRESEARFKKQFRNR